jgi:hypothetical protein
VKQVAAGGYHTCVVLNDDTLKCFGFGQDGQLGSESTANIGSSANEMGDNLPIVEVGAGRTVKQESAGNYHTCVVLDDDTLKCFGFGQYGQIGSDSTANTGSSANEMGGYLPTVDLQGPATLCAGNNSGCTEIGEGDGDCDTWSGDCAAGLVCGDDSCKNYRSPTGWPWNSENGFDTTDDCCEIKARYDLNCWNRFNNISISAVDAPKNWSLLASQPNVRYFPEPCLRSSLSVRFEGSAILLHAQEENDIRYIMQGYLDCWFENLAQIIMTNTSLTDCEWRIEFFFALVAESSLAQKQILTLLEGFAANGTRAQNLVPSCTEQAIAQTTDFQVKLGLQLLKARYHLLEFVFDEQWPDRPCFPTTSGPSTTAGVSSAAPSTTDVVATASTSGGNASTWQSPETTSSAQSFFALKGEALYILLPVICFSA